MGTRVRMQFVLVALGALVTSAALSAHDMWIEPASFVPNPGEIVALRLRVGQDLLGDPIARDARLIREFIVEDGDGRRPVVGRDGADPAGLVRAAAPGLLVVGYHSTPSIVELGAEKFDQYLREEGLDAILAQRQHRALPAAGARDAFTRCAKSLLLTGAADAQQRDRTLGLPLELVAERNPYALEGSAQLPVRLTYLGKPLAGALVVAINRRHPAEPQRLRSDRDGRVRFQIQGGGTWLIKAVHMVPSAPGSGADWDSYWASLTFGPPAAQIAAAPRATSSR